MLVQYSFIFQRNPRAGIDKESGIYLPVVSCTMKKSTPRGLFILRYKTSAMGMFLDLFQNVEKWRFFGVSHDVIALCVHSSVRMAQSRHTTQHVSWITAWGVAVFLALISGEVIFLILVLTTPFSLLFLLHPRFMRKIDSKLGI